MDNSANPEEVIKGGTEVDETFTIPKKNTTKPDADEATLVEAGQGSVMANAYGSFMPASHAYQTGASFAAWASQQSSAYYSDYCQYVMNLNKADASQSGALKRAYEEPKTTRTDVTYRESFFEVNDPSLPKELIAMFQPLYCKLCSAQLSSNVMAKMHYRSKNHEKKVRRFLIDHSEKTGEPLHKRAKVKKAQTEPEEYDSRYFHCDACDLPLTGRTHAESHYMGKNHQKVILGKKPPAGKGYYNEEGRWVRTVLTKSGIPSGHDGFGMDFLPAKQEVKPDTSLHCELCNVSVTSMPQMEMHLQGQKHCKKLRQQPSTSAVAFKSELPSAEQNGEVLIAKNAFPVNQADLLCSYRTPSGQYYCKTCNISLNSETQFMQHLNSKKHLKKNVSKE